MIVTTLQFIICAGVFGICFVAGSLVALSLHGSNTQARSASLIALASVCAGAAYVLCGLPGLLGALTTPALYMLSLASKGEPGLAMHGGSAALDDEEPRGLHASAMDLIWQLDQELSEREERTRLSAHPLACLDELHDAEGCLDRAVQAYTRGSYTRAVRIAAQGLELIQALREREQASGRAISVSPEADRESGTAPSERKD